MKTTMKVSTSSQAALSGAFLAQQGIKLSATIKCRSIPAADDQDCKSVAEWLRTEAADPKSTPQVWLVCRPGPDDQALLGTVEAEGYEKAQAAARSQWPAWASDLHAFYAPAVAKIHEKHRRRIARDPFPVAFAHAGPAVVARHHGFGVVRVDILPQMFSSDGEFAPYHDTFGRTSYRWPLLGHTKQDRRMTAEAVMASTLAGSAAKARFRPGRNLRNSNEREMAFIIHLLLEHGRVDVERYFAEMKARARELVRDYWTDIQTVATALAERHELTGDDIDDLLTDHAAENLS